MSSEQVLRGALAGLAYGVVERLFASDIPWLLKPSFAYQPPNRAAVLFLLLLYACAGAALQASLAVALRGRRQEAIDVAVRLSMIGVFAANFTFEYLPPHLMQARKLYGIAMVLQAVALIGIVLAEFFATGRAIGTIPLSCLLVLPWYLIIDRYAQRHLMFKATIGCISILAIVVISWLLRAHLTRQAANRAMATCAVLMVAVAELAPQTVDRMPAPKPSRLSASSPNVVIISLDTVRADHLSVYGYSRRTSPNLAQFAQHATVFTHAFSSGDMTLSSHASLFTGLEPRSHGAHFNSDSSIQPLGRGVPTMSEILASRGYDTIAVVSNAAFLSHAYGLNRGFRYYDERVQPPFLSQMSEYLIGRGVIDIARRTLSPMGLFVSVRSAEAVNRDVDEALKRGSHRFFLFVNYMDAHWPYASPQPFAKMFPGSTENYGPDAYLGHTLAKDASAEYCRVLTARYDCGIAYLDDQLGKLFDDLRRRQLYDDTLIIIMADHGEAFGERGQLSHGMSVYQNQIHVPLIVKAPGQTNPLIVTTAVSSVDVFHTVLAACNAIPLPAGAVDLTRESSAIRGVLAEHFGVIDADQVAVTDGNLKLIRDATGSVALYDLASDAFEQRNLYNDPAYRTRASDLQAKLGVLLALAEREKQKINRVSVGDENFLRSLGYLR